MGFSNFTYLFKTKDAFNITRNTLLYNLCFIVLGTVIAITIAILLNEITSKLFKQVYQTIILMPYLIVLYVDLSSPGFFSQMYETAVGRVVMTGCLVVYLLAWRVSGKILQIEV